MSITRILAVYRTHPVMIVVGQELVTNGASDLTN